MSSEIERVTEYEKGFPGMKIKLMMITFDDEDASTKMLIIVDAKFKENTSGHVRKSSDDCRLRTESSSLSYLSSSYDHITNSYHNAMPQPHHFCFENHNICTFWFRKKGLHKRGTEGHNFMNFV